MPGTPSFHSQQATVFWPARGALAPFTVTVSPCQSFPCSVQVDVSYVPTIMIGDEIFSSINWTRLSFLYASAFAGTIEEFQQWCTTDNGRRRTIDDIQRLQDHVVDHLKSAHPHHCDIANLRHFGPAEWPYVSSEVNGKQVLVIVNTSARALIASTPLAADTATMASGQPVPLEARTILRACDLATCGYPTEAVLTAIAVLDAKTQEILTKRMGDLGISKESSESLLRNTTTSRLSTYLGPVLKLAVGSSLDEDNHALFQSLANVNRQRNNAIHNGQELKRSEAQAAILVIYDVLDYLRVVASPELSLPVRPSF